MDRLLREGNPPAGQLASPKPQYKKPGVDEYAPVEGQHGAPFAILKDASGAVVSPATEATLEQVRALLSGVATENKLEQARTLLDAISTKDFATSSKQDALKIAVEDLKSELNLVKSELEAIKANQTSGDQKVQLSGTYVELGKVPAVSLAPGESLIILEEGFYNVKEVSVGFRTQDARTLQLYIRYATRDAGQSGSLKTPGELLYDNKGEATSSRANFVANFPIKHPYFQLYITNTHADGTVIWSNGRIMGRVV